MPRRGAASRAHLTPPDDLPRRQARSSPSRTTKTSVLADIDTLARSFERSLRASNRSVRTVETYMEAVHQLHRFLVERGMPTDVTAIHREHVETYIERLLQTRKPATASNRFRAVQQFFKYLLE